MRRELFAVAAAGVAGLLALTACTSSGSDDVGNGEVTIKAKVGVILPDSSTSPRWEAADRPYLKTAFEHAGIYADIENAQGDYGQYQTIAANMINSGVKALLIVSLDNDSGKAVIDRANAAGIPVIDYDRLTLGGGAKYYVSFDNVDVGTAIGDGLIKCMQDDHHRSGPVVELNGSPDDNNATLFRQGYDTALKKAGYTIAASKPVPGWDVLKAASVFDGIDATLKNNFVGVAAANDTLGGAVVARLHQEGMDHKIPVTGQDASVEGLQRLLLGTQCVTIYKSTKAEANAAAQLAIDVIRGDTAAANALASGSADDTLLHRQVPSVILKPLQVTAENVKAVVADGAVTPAQICTTKALKTACTKYGVTTAAASG